MSGTTVQTSLKRGWKWIYDFTLAALLVHAALGFVEFAIPTADTCQQLKQYSGQKEMKLKMMPSVIENSELQKEITSLLPRILHLTVRIHYVHSFQTVERGILDTNILPFFIPLPLKGARGIMFSGCLSSVRKPQIYELRSHVCIVVVRKLKSLGHLEASKLWPQ